MGPIDRKLRSLGYTIQKEGSNWASYVRHLYDLDGRELDISNQVLIQRRKEDHNLVKISSHTLGSDCEWGKSCTFPLYFRDLKWFYLKAAHLKMKWWVVDVVKVIRKKIREVKERKWR